MGAGCGQPSRADVEEGLDPNRGNASHDLLDQDLPDIIEYLNIRQLQHFDDLFDDPRLNRP